LYSSALTHFNAGRHAQAKQELKKVLATDPRHAGALHLAGLIAYRQQQYREAAALIGSAIALQPDSRMYCNLALVDLAQARPEEAIEHCRQSLLLQPEQFDAHYNMGLACQSMGDLDRAEACYRKSLEQDSANARALNNLGVVLEARGRSQEAVSAFAQAIDCQSDFAMAHYNLAISRDTLGDYGGAVSSYRHTLKLQPDNASAHNNLGVALKNLRLFPEAADSYRQAVRLQPGFADAHQNLGDVLAILGSTDEAIASHRKAITLQWDREPVKDRYTRKIETQAARHTLLEARSLLTGAGIRFFPYAGTLLGLVRDGDILPHDKDLDIALSWEEDRDAVLHALTAPGRFVCPGRDSLTEADKTWYINVHHADTRVDLDLFFMQPDGKHFLVGVKSHQRSTLSRPRRFQLRPFTWQGVDWLIPDPPEGLLAELYGPGWHKPDPDFDTVVSSNCLTEESRPWRRCHGYSRLYSQLRSGQMNKVRAYCRQLLKLHPDDPFLRELCEKLADPVQDP